MFIVWEIIKTCLKKTSEPNQLSLGIFFYFSSYGHVRGKKLTSFWICLLSRVLLFLKHRWIKSKFSDMGDGEKLYSGKLITPFCTKNRNILTIFIIFIENRSKNAIQIVILCKMVTHCKELEQLDREVGRSPEKNTLTVFIDAAKWKRHCEVCRVRGSQWGRHL